MEHLNGQFSNWKQLLLAGQVWVGKEDARGGGQNLLAQIHRRSNGDPEAESFVYTAQNFVQLRIEPYLLECGCRRHPELCATVRDWKPRGWRARANALCTVISGPKNILMSAERMVLLDCEVACYGEPAFDIAFLLNHFFLKSLLHAPRATGLGFIDCSALVGVSSRAAIA